MSRGRKPKPIAQHKAEGSFRHSRHAGKVDAPAGVPDCPEFLSEPAKEEWHRIIAETNAMGLISRLDRASLAIYCEAWAAWMLNNGVNESKRLLQVCREFGFTPSSRASIKFAPVTEESEDDKLFGVVG